MSPNELRIEQRDRPNGDSYTLRWRLGVTAAAVEAHCEVCGRKFHKAIVDDHGLLNVASARADEAYDEHATQSHQGANP